MRKILGYGTQQQASQCSRQINPVRREEERTRESVDASNQDRQQPKHSPYIYTSPATRIEVIGQLATAVQVHHSPVDSVTHSSQAASPMRGKESGIRIHRDVRAGRPPIALAEVRHLNRNSDMRRGSALPCRRRRRELPHLCGRSHPQNPQEQVKASSLLPTRCRCKPCRPSLCKDILLHLVEDDCYYSRECCSNIHQFSKQVSVIHSTLNIGGHITQPPASHPRASRAKRLLITIRTHRHFTAAVAGPFWRNLHIVDKTSHYFVRTFHLLFWILQIDRTHFHVRIHQTIKVHGNVSSCLRVHQHATPEGNYNHEQTAYFYNKSYDVINPLKQRLLHDCNINANAHTGPQQRGQLHRDHASPKGDAVQGGGTRASCTEEDQIPRTVQQQALQDYPTTHQIQGNHTPQVPRQPQLHRHLSLLRNDERQQHSGGPQQLGTTRRGARMELTEWKAFGSIGGMKRLRSHLHRTNTGHRQRDQDRQKGRQRRDRTGYPGQGEEGARIQWGN